MYVLQQWICCPDGAIYIYTAYLVYMRTAQSLASRCQLAWGTLGGGLWLHQVRQMYWS